MAKTLQELQTKIASARARGEGYLFPCPFCGRQAGLTGAGVRGRGNRGELFHEAGGCVPFAQLDRASEALEALAEQLDEIELLRTLAHVVMAGTQRRELVIGNNQARSVARLLEAWLRRFERPRLESLPPGPGDQSEE